MRYAFKRAFPHTLPVLFGYLFLGMAFGILLNSAGYNAGWALTMSVFVFAGSMQFVAVGLLSGPINFLNVLLLTLTVNARHVTYGISMLKKFRQTGKFKPYLIFALTDETYSLLCSVDPPENVDKGKFYFAISILNHSYWISGGVIGALLGSLVTFNTTGIDFVLTALFVVILIGQWESTKQHLPTFLGIGITLLCLWIFGSEYFLIPSLIAMISLLILLRGRIKGVEKDA